MGLKTPGRCHLNQVVTVHVTAQGTDRRHGRADVTSCGHTEPLRCSCPTCRTCISARGSVGQARAAGRSTESPACDCHDNITEDQRAGDLLPMKETKERWQLRAMCGPGLGGGVGGGCNKHHYWDTWQNWNMNYSLDNRSVSV